MKNKNFGFLIPSGCTLHTDGKPIMGVDPKDKKEFSKWFNENNHDHNMDLREKEKLFMEWKNKISQSTDSNFTTHRNILGQITGISENE